MVLGAGAATGLTPTAQAQIRIEARGMGGGPGEAGMVSKRSVEKYADTLNLSKEQAETAATIHEGYAAAYGEVRKMRRAAMEEVRRASEDTGDHSVFMEKMPKIEREFQEKTGKLEKEFFNDLQSVLDSGQQDRWVRVERMRRREVGMRGGAISGEGVDLVEVVGNLKLEEPATSVIATPLEEYEAEVDRHLQSRDRLKDEAPAFEPGKGIDIEALQKAMAESREAGLKIKDVNERHARKIEGLLPEDKRGAFRDAVKRRSFPRVYKPSRASKDIEAALKMDDLDAGQRAALEGLRESYERDLAGANDAWAAAQEESEKTGSSGAIAGGSGGMMMLNMGEEPPALVEARKARRELDDKANERIKSVLTEAQKSRLPKGRGQDEDEGGMEGDFHTVDTIMIRGGG